MDTTGPDAAHLFSRISIDRASYAIVDQVHALIRTGALRPGDRLPNERDLCQQFGVSRVTVREALRVLEATGLIEVRLGSMGGSFLTAPSPQVVGGNLAHLLTLSPITAVAATAARQVFELGMLPLVVKRATPTDITDLRDMVQTGMSAKAAGEYTSEMSAAFHSRLAAATHNAVIEALMESFHDPLLSSLRHARAVEPDTGTAGIQEHAHLIDAIAERNLERASTVLAAHLERTARRISQLIEKDEANTIPTNENDVV